MTLDELIRALSELVEQGVEPDEPVCLQIGNECFEAKSITVVVHSDLWVPGTVVLTGTLIDEDGEADDG